jgi:3-deoxy-D-manno-octulosonic acid kinase
VVGGLARVTHAIDVGDVDSRAVVSASVSADVTAYRDVLDALVALVAEHGTLYDWAAERPQPRALRGRAPVFVATLPDRDDTVVVRHAWHGGLLAPLTGDQFLVPTRAPLELRNSAMLRAFGIPTSHVLGYARYAAWPGFRRVDVVTRYIPDAYDLGMVAAGLAGQIDRDEALAATIRLLAQMAAHGVSHPDLNVKNVLVREHARGELEALVIDVDVISVDDVRSPVDTMRANVARLLRSMRKWRSQFGCDVAEARMTAFANEAMAATPARAALVNTTTTSVA